MIDRQEALALAKEAVLRAGLFWDEPVVVRKWSHSEYSIWTNANTHGGNVSVRLNRRSGVATVKGMTVR